MVSYIVENAVMGLFENAGRESLTFKAQHHHPFIVMNHDHQADIMDMCLLNYFTNVNSECLSY